MPLHMIYRPDNFQCGVIWTVRVSRLEPVVERFYTWSKDSSAELAKGWIKKAIPSPSCEDNQPGPASAARERLPLKMNAADGQRPGFRTDEDVAPIEGPPYYGHGSDAAFCDTQGGPRRNGRSPDRAGERRGPCQVIQRRELGSIHSYLYNPAQHRRMVWLSEGLRGETRGGSSLEINRQNEFN